MQMQDTSYGVVYPVCISAPHNQPVKTIKSLTKNSNRFSHNSIKWVFGSIITYLTMIQEYSEDIIIYNFYFIISFTLTVASQGIRIKSSTIGFKKV